MYFGLTARSVDILRDGGQRIWKTGVVNRDWDGSWTLLGFSLPESWQRQRHDLRSQLTWAGFGRLQGGLWIAPGHVTVDRIVADLGLGAHVRVFRAHADQLTDTRQMINDAYDLGQLAAGYRTFLNRWDSSPTAPFPHDPLAAHLSLVTEWLQTIRQDPRLPVQHLPDNWPAVPAQQAFHHIEAHLDQPARTLAIPLLHTIPDQVRLTTSESSEADQ
jgi:phenylacetic acid degradation operon negative regulatory protein